MSNSLKNHLYAVISGKSEVRHGKIIQTIANDIRESQRTSTTSKGSKLYKEQEKQKLESYISKNQFWVNHIDFNQYVSEGAEQKVYLNDQKSVIKLNDSIYYNSWEDYFHNLLLHNTFFEDTAYQLMGFHTENDNLFAVVEQPFVEVTTTTNLEHIKEFLLRNGFSNTRNNDYYNRELGLILEDLHDENVLTKDGLLYFIDTVFYLTDEFWIDFNNLD
jgi:hypothetical protein